MVKTLSALERIDTLPHEAYILGMGDLHIGSPYVAYERIEADLKEARRRNARIIINGDVFDFILPKDQKRFTPTALHSRLQNRSDVVNAAIDWAVEIISPYTDMIDVIGLGNHETAVEKYHGTDAVSALVTELNRHHGGRIDYGGYCGFYRRQWVYGDRRYFNFTLYRHHGAGGAAPITKGMIDFSRMLSFIDADAIQLGHKHNRIVDATPVRMRLNAAGEIVQERTVCFMAGSYMQTYNEQTSEDALSGGRRGNYAHEWNCAPQSPGGVFLRLRMDSNGLTVSAEI